MRYILIPKQFHHTCHCERGTSVAISSFVGKMGNEEDEITTSLKRINMTHFFEEPFLK